ncbi:MAG: hypothetical protein JXR19_08255, partial [Bacteroidia bacterium]
MRVLKIYLFFMIIHPSLAQTQQPNYEYWLHFINRSNNEDLEEEWLYIYLLNLQSNPVELNIWSKDKIRDCLIFSSLQSEEIIAHRDEYGSFLSVYELRCLSSFDTEHIRQLIPYLSSNYSYRARQKSQFSWNVHHKIKLPNSNNSSLGNSWKQQYKAHYQNALWSGSFRTEKDEGERLFNEMSKSLDFTSFFILFPKLFNRYKIIIGDYQLQYGQGLNLYTQRTISRNGAFASAKMIHLGMNPYRSFRENAALRGIAVQTKFKACKIDLYFSKSKRDAGIENNQFSGFNSDGGLHRTLSEYGKRDQLSDMQYGAHLEKEIGTLKLGVITSFRQFEYNPKIPTSVHQRFENSNRKSNRHGLYMDYYLMKFN